VLRSFVEVEHPLVCCIGPAVVVLVLRVRVSAFWSQEMGQFPQKTSIVLNINCRRYTYVTRVVFLSGHNLNSILVYVLLCC
jgi:hypothetical protein